MKIDQRKLVFLIELEPSTAILVAGMNKVFGKQVGITQHN